MAGKEMSKDEIRTRLFAEAEERAAMVRKRLMADAEHKAEAAFGDFIINKELSPEKMRERLLQEAEIKADMAFGDWMDQPGR